MRDLIDKAVSERTWAVVGASNDRSKFGNKIYRDLRAAGYKVYPVHPTETEVEGDTAYASVKDLPEKPAVVDVVVPSWVGQKVARETAEAGIPYFWLQPGAESDELIRNAMELGLNVIHNACAMVEKRRWEDG
jgi:predicted CoA-binding protein